MEMKTESLRTTLVEEVEHIKDDHTYPDLGRAFQHWSAVNILGIADGVVAAKLDDAMGADGGIDYFHVDDHTKTIEIIQAKFSEGEGAHIDKKQILEFYEIPRQLLIKKAKQNSRFQDMQRQYEKLKKKKYATRLLFITTANLSESAKSTVTSKNFEMPNDTTFECIELKDLIAYVGNPRSPPCRLELNKDECFIGAPCGLQTKRLVSTVPASELKNICDFIGIPTLFSLNPRSSLGANAISKDIKDTIEKQPERLWHYNNGISATCERFNYDKETGVVRIENLKVVNGCQTVTTIARMKDVNSGAGLVLRLSETADTSFSEKISEYTNKQTRIKSADLLSNHPYLINLEKRFKRHGKFFFERKKGQKSGIHTKKTLYVIKNVDAARLKMAYGLGRPDLSMQLPESSIFKLDPDDPDESSLFSDIYKSSDPRDFIIPAIFYYLLGVIKKDMGQINLETNDDDKNDVIFLLKYKIGRYYVLGMVGEIFRSMSSSSKGKVVNAIISNATKYDDKTMNKIYGELLNLVKWIAHEMTDVIGNSNGKPLHKQNMYYLRDPLCKDNRLPKLYHKRQSLSKYSGGRDSFGTKLLGIVNAPATRTQTRNGTK